MKPIFTGPRSWPCARTVASSSATTIADPRANRMVGAILPLSPRLRSLDAQLLRDAPGERDLRDLAERRQRQLGDDLQALGQLEPGDAGLGEMADELGERQALPRPGDHEGARQLAVHRPGHRPARACLDAGS